jgi:hypothetical protein
MTLRDVAGWRSPLGVLAWLLAVQVQPLVHNVGHRNDHSHGPQAHDRDHGHEHDHDHDAPAIPIPDDHGAGSTLHYAAAMAAAPVFTLPPPSFDAAGARDEKLRHVADRRSSPPISRGPPFSLQFV